jgi:hypothetical protein
MGTMPTSSFANVSFVALVKRRLRGTGRAGTPGTEIEADTPRREERTSRQDAKVWKAGIIGESEYESFADARRFGDGVENLLANGGRSTVDD